MERKKRTHIDWSTHEVTVIENEHVVIHHLQKPDSIHANVKFINTSGILAVTGDYGNWIFCRRFIPSEEGFVSDSYWSEKLEILSKQESQEFSDELTIKELNFMIDSGAEEYGYEGKELEQMKEYYQDCLSNMDSSEMWYASYAYSNFPSFADYDCVVLVKEYHYWLKAVFDAFDEICDRIEKEVNQPV